MFIRFINFFMYHYEFMSRGALAVMARDMYNKYLKDHSRNKWPMRCAMILQHFEHHQPSLRIQRIVRLRVLAHMRRIIESQLRLVDAVTKAERLDDRQMKAWRSVMDEQDQLMVLIEKHRPAQV